MLRNAIQTMTGAAVLAGAGFLAMLALASGQVPSGHDEKEVATNQRVRDSTMTSTTYLPIVSAQRPSASISSQDCSNLKGSQEFTLGVTGVVDNPSDQSLTNTQVRVTLYVSGTAIATNTIGAFPATILPQQNGLFATNFPCPPKRGQVEAQLLSWDDQSNTRLRPLTVVGTFQNIYVIPTELYVLVRNDQTISLTNVSALSAVNYGGFGFVQPSDPVTTVLAPNATLTLRMHALYALFLDPAVAQGEIYP
jgi:hypothetical protein